MLISVDICSRGNVDFKWGVVMTLVMSFGIYLPWVLTNDKKKKDKTRGMGLALSGLFASLIVLVASAFPQARTIVTKVNGVPNVETVSKITPGESLQGGVITLMYMFVSTSLGYQAVRAKKDPVAKAQSIYMTGLLVLLLMFDILGAHNAGSVLKPATTPPAADQPNAATTKPEPAAATEPEPAAAATRATRLNQLRGLPVVGGLFGSVKPPNPQN